MSSSGHRNSTLFKESVPEHWAEKWGSYVISLALGLMMAAILFVTPIRLVQASPTSLPMVFVLAPALLEPPPQIEPLPEEEIEEDVPEEVLENEPQLFEEAVATSANASESADEIKPAEEASFIEEDSSEFQVAIAMPQLPTPLQNIQQNLEELDSPEEAEEEAPTLLEDWRPDSEADQQRIKQLLSQLVDEQERLEEKTTGVKAQINRRMIETAGREFEFNSDGGREGMIRLLDVEGFPEGTVRNVLNRYGITIEYRSVSAEQLRQLRDRRTYFNAVSTDQGEFTTSLTEGRYEVFTLSSKALAMLGAIERKALNKKSYNPRTTRVRKVVFGIVLDDADEYALGVVDLEVERIR